MTDRECPYLWGGEDRPEHPLNERCAVCGSTGADVGIYGGGADRCVAQALPVKLTAIEGGGLQGTGLTGEMAERIKGVVYEYAGRVPVAAAIGVLRIVEQEILDEQ